MFLARVTGTVVATIKDAALEGQKLLLLRRLDEHGLEIGSEMVGLDAAGAGIGETVTCCRGKEASFAWLPRAVPTDLAVVGIVDPRRGGR